MPLGGEWEEEARAPLVERKRRNNSLSRRLRDEFVGTLPEKVRGGIIDPEKLDVDFSKAKGLSNGEKEYYDKQFAALKSFEEVDCMDGAVHDNDSNEEYQNECAMKISNYANILLLLLKICATIRSGSLAIAASTLDSLLDLMAGGILWFTYLSMKSINVYKYPIGKLRAQPVGIIIFAAVMATLAVHQSTTLHPAQSRHSKNCLNIVFPEEELERGKIQ